MDKIIDNLKKEVSFLELKIQTQQAIIEALKETIFNIIHSITNTKKGDQ